MIGAVFPDQDEGPALEADPIIEAALAEFRDFGFRRVSIGDVARRAGIHRATVYRRFATKEQLLVAASIAWARQFFNGVMAAVATLESFDDRLAEGFLLSLKGLREDPLLTRLLTSDRDEVLPFLTVKGGPVLDAVTGFFALQYRAAFPGNPEVDQAAEVAARIGLSLLLTPSSRIPLSTDDEIRTFARRYLLRLA